LVLPLEKLTQLSQFLAMILHKPAVIEACLSKLFLLQGVGREQKNIFQEGVLVCCYAGSAPFFLRLSNAN
jgi:hypothetical protein